MQHNEFIIGQEFFCGGRAWRCTDRGTRVIVAIPLEDNETVTVLVTDGKIAPETRSILSRPEAERQGWFRGPPYAVAEMVFDEHSMEACDLTRQTYD